MKTLRVMLADDYAPFRRMLADFLTSHASVSVVGEVSNGKEAVDLAARLKPDLIFMDVSMPGMSGLDATRAIKTRYPGMKVVILSPHAGEMYRRAAFECSADGYIEKDHMKSDIQRLLEQYPAISVRTAV